MMNGNDAQPEYTQKKLAHKLILSNDLLIAFGWRAQGGCSPEMRPHFQDRIIQQSNGVKHSVA